MRKYLAEAIGTFCLVFAGTGAVIINDVTAGGVTHVGIAMTFGLVIMAMIYAVGDVSGAHLNPAVSIGFCVAGRLPIRHVFFYILSQLCGAIIASVSLRCMFGNRASLGATFPLASPWQSFFLEAILTAILMFVILSVSSGSKEVGTMAGIAIGGVIALEAIFAGPISGASMNPARSIAPAIVSGDLRNLWVYIAAPIIGAIVAVPFWKGSRPAKLLPADRMGKI
jgi:MIP family channel proteins